MRAQYYYVMCMMFGAVRVREISVVTENEHEKNETELARQNRIGNALIILEMYKIIFRAHFVRRSGYCMLFVIVTGPTETKRTESNRTNERTNVYICFFF